jgi:N utilization substance protein A
VQIKGVARELGQRIIVAVHSTDPAVCPVGSCVGPKGHRVKTITKQLPGDKVDIVRWSESIEDFIRNAIAPARAERIVFDAASHSATIHPAPEDKPLIIGRLHLISKLVGWDLRVTDT